MYLEYFNLKTNPFGITPDPKFLYLSHPHNTVVEWMRFAIEQHEFGLVIGEVGSGKTVISRYLIDNLPEDKYKICWIVNPGMSPVQFLREIYNQLFEGDAPRSKAELIKLIQDGLINLFIEKRYPVIIIDEAQAIPGSKVFEELRLLSNFQTDEQNLFSIILLGQPELRKKITRKNYRAFLQRIRFTITLEPLSYEDMHNYLKHRLKIAGTKKQIFTNEAVKIIYLVTKGYPRPINHLASFAMLEAVSNEKKIIDADIVKNASRSILYFNETNNSSGSSDLSEVEKKVNNSDS